MVWRKTVSSKNRCALAVAGVSWCLCAIVPAVRAEGDLWQTDFEAAKAKAKAENKLLLVDFTGSDWCPYCKKLKGEVFDKDQFKAEAPKHFVLVELDFPRHKEVPDDLKAQNEKLAKQYKIGGFPTVLLLDAAGQTVAQTGYQPGGPEEFVKQLGGFLDVYASVLKMKQELVKAKGIERAKLLDKIVEAYADKLHNEIDELADWSKEIVKLDADNKAGLRGKHEFRLCIAEFEKLMNDRKLVEGKKKLDEALAIQGITADQKKIAQEQLDRLTPIFAAQEAAVELKAKLQAAKGLDRAKILDKLIEADKTIAPFMPGDEVAQTIQDVRNWAQEIVNLDAKNEAGLKSKYGFQVKMMEVITQAQSGNVDKALAALDEAEALPDLTDRQKSAIENIRKQLPKAKTAPKSKS
jgi:thioredoxin-related protein